MMSLNRWAQALMTRTRVWTGDGYNLIRAVVHQQNNNGNDIRTILVTQARDHSNTMAISLLKVNQQIGLLQYHGFIGYCKQSPMANVVQRFLNGTGGNPSIQANENNGSKKEKPLTNNKTAKITTMTRARVAFMITTTQKDELKHRLGYDVAEIKKLSPLKASLILQHDISCEQLKEEKGSALLESLVEEHHEEITKQNRQSMTQQEPGHQITAAALNDDTTTTKNAIDEKDGNSEPALMLEGYSNPSVPEKKQNNNTTEQSQVSLQGEATETKLQTSTASIQRSEGQGTSIDESTTEEEREFQKLSYLLNSDDDASESWYEVVEIHHEDNDKHAVTRNVVALYSTKKEAEFFVAIKEEFAMNRQRQKEEKSSQDQGGDDTDLLCTSRYEIRSKQLQ
mmetsp:Transcript_14331/g.22374  ORF Transcript_14331/g.22374 Transcript_14331/m.22374 type:complete len:397 (-) Transcript_14331:224-1414(-)